VTLPHQDDFAGISDWVFDLDNTLYPAACNLFFEIDSKMTQFIEGLLDLPYEAARKIQKGLYVEHGTTLAGLMIDHKVDPHDFMDYVHDIDLSKLSPDPALRAALTALPGRKLVHTNGSVKHAENVLGALGLDGVMDELFDVEMGNWSPKPQESNYQLFRKRFDVDPTKAAMFEDMVVNLEVPHALGMRTVLITSDAEWLADEPAEKRPGAGHENADHIHHVTPDLTAFLQALTTDKRKTA